VCVKSAQPSAHSNAHTKSIKIKLRQVLKTNEGKKIVPNKKGHRNGD